MANALLQSWRQDTVPKQHVTGNPLFYSFFALLVLVPLVLLVVVVAAAVVVVVTVVFVPAVVHVLLLAQLEDRSGVRKRHLLDEGPLGRDELLC